MSRRLLCAVLVSALAACAPAAQPGTGANAVRPVPSALGGTPDTTGLNLVPAGYGSLRQDEIALRMRLPSVLVRVIPLDESIIRLLAPDSYRALHNMREGARDAVARAARMRGVSLPSLWYVAYYGVQPDARFDPRDMVISSGGRDFRPIDIVPLSAGFGGQRVGQRQVQSAIYLFGAEVNVHQPLTVVVDGVRDASWSSLLPTLERERSLVRSRAR